MLKLILTVVLCVYQVNGSLRAVDTYISPTENARLDKVFAEGLKSNDLQSIYYSVLNMKMTKNIQQDVCNRLAEAYELSKLNEFEKNFYLVGTFNRLNCDTALPQNALDYIASSLSKDSATAQEIFFNLLSSKVMAIDIDKNLSSKVAKNLQNILKKDDSITSLGYAFYVASELEEAGAFVVDRVEDAVVQADEVDGKMLQFEGGLSITGLVFTGAFRVTKAFNKPAPINADQAVKFATYFLSRKSVQTVKGAHVLLDALRTLVDNKKLAPASIKLVGNGQLQPESPKLSVSVVDLLGSSVVPPITSVTAKIFNKKDNSVAVEKLKLEAKSSDKSVFVGDLSSYKLERGMYTAEILADLYKHSVHFKILGKAKVQSLEIGVGDADSTSAIKKQTVQYPHTLLDVLTADHTQKVVLKVTLVDEATNKPISVHQAFVRLANKESGEEIIFVAEQDTSKAYKFDMDVGSGAAAFGHKSGSYKLELIIGDASLSNSFQWHVSDIDINFATRPKKVTTPKSRSPLPEIVHMFREPEKRPPRFVSDLFTGLCLAPLVLLLIFWVKLRVNFGNFSFGLSTIGFHLGFAAILGLFGVFWLQLDMFETIRYLLPVALFTFLCGNHMLRTISAQKPSA